MTKDAAPPESCPRCGGSGILIAEDMSTTRCDCGVWEREGFRMRHARARLPRRYERKTLKGFRAERGDTRRGKILEHARAYAKAFNPGQEMGLLLRGDKGSGKTHIAVGILIEVLRNGATGLYWNVTDLLAHLRQSYARDAEESESAILADADAVDLLVLDDLGAESATDWVRDRLYLIINRRYEAARATIITTNCDDLELAEKVGARIVSRIHEMCDPFDPFPGEDYRLAMARRG
mgnify:CR=1 FL=1